MNNTLTNGLALLSLIANSGKSHGVTELAHMSGLPKSHVHRLLQSLVEARYLDKDYQSRYRISVGALRLGRELLRNIPIRQTALPEMLSVAPRESLSLTLALPFGYEAITVAHTSPVGTVRGPMESIGSVLSSHASASGKLFLAYKEDSELQEILPELIFEPLGPNTHKDASSLLDDLKRIRGRGYSINNCENGFNTISLACPITDQDGKVFAALGCSGATESLPLKKTDHFVGVLNSAINNIRLNLKQEITSL